MDIRRHAPLEGRRAHFSPHRPRRPSRAYLGRARRQLADIYTSDHTETRQGGRFRWLVSTCLAATIGGLAILVVIAGSTDTRESEGGFLQTLQSPLPTFNLRARDGLRWASPKTDRLVIPSGAMSTRFHIVDPVWQRRGNRDYIWKKPYARVVARLAPVSRAQAESIPPFEPSMLYANPTPVGESDRQGSPGGLQAAAIKVLDLLSGVLPSEDGQELDLNDVLELVARLQLSESEAGALRGGPAPEAGDQIARGALEAVPPNTSLLVKSVFETEDLAEGLEVDAPRMGRTQSGDTLYASLFYAAAAQGISPEMVLQIMRIHAYDTDFRQRVRPGDAVEFFFEVREEEKGADGALGELLATAITTGGETHKYYRFRTPDGVVDYYDEFGNTSRKFLMRLPLRGDVRLTSGFGMRRHPMLQVMRMHTGEDWSAPPGTPVMAAGSGVIEETGRKGEYGNYIRIRHANGYKTAYAHLSRFAPGVSEGVKVRQGQIIGYVGNTGLASGPHLHYEVLIDQNAVDPKSIQVQRESRLTGKQLADFQKERARIDKLMSRNPVLTKVASASAR
jgi:murein DD-endopeptidase MepM/ murein hydrolase activator NlpD